MKIIIASNILKNSFPHDCRFQDLSSVLEPGRPAKTDKPAILDDAIRVLNQLKNEAQELKETNEKLLEEIKSLKVVTFNTHLTTTTIIPSAVSALNGSMIPLFEYNMIVQKPEESDTIGLSIPSIVCRIFF
jgi:hypothetical protein